MKILPEAKICEQISVILNACFEKEEFFLVLGDNASLRPPLLEGGGVPGDKNGMGVGACLQCVCGNVHPENKETSQSHLADQQAGLDQNGVTWLSLTSAYVT